jgi:GAF domain-containing protein
MPEQHEYFRILCDLSHAFGQARNRRELLELLFQTAITTMDAKAACLYLVDAAKPDLIPLAQKGLSAHYFRSRESVLDARMVHHLLESGNLFIRDAATDPRLQYPEAKKTEGIASILAVLVMVKGRPIGVFCLFTATSREFSPGEIEFLTVLAQQSGGVMEHARLIDQVRKNTRLFLDLAAKVNASLEVSKILPILSEEIARALGVKAASIRLLDEERQVLELVASYGLSDQYLRKGPVSAKKSIALSLAGKPVFIKNAATDSRVQYGKENAAEGILSILSVPIKTKDKVIGVLRLYSGVPRKFTVDEIELVTALAHLGGLAIQNASMYMLCQEDMKELMEDLWSHRSWF